ncbi:GNAT family N-acetyltransferase [Jiella sonneratiae]|uniref:GNAT family N-acetyltransferase n=1 Tax=Jiella sonneratiae TaxID=2816856 RepID=A0ABS3J8R4_9HYPH|nr:GNAT family N-acetyltransferase [Jiella sonneratiae]MBO0904961.1 GNAT family N-acetyltransferase [Jiella sonneratiae]
MAGEGAGGLLRHPPGPQAAAWRKMTADDLSDLCRLAGRIHPGLPEDAAVFEERLSLFPAGCFVLSAEGGLAGYAIAHPIRFPEPPKLNTLLGAIARDADAFYLHDVAVAPEHRGRRHAETVVARLIDAAADFPRICLVSVYGTAPFWRRFGFADASGNVAPHALSGYGPDARFMVRLTPD